MCLPNERCDVGRARSSYVHDKVGMTLRNLRLTISHTLQTHHLYQSSGIIAGRIFKDRASALLRWLRPFTILLMFLNYSAQDQGVLTVKRYPHLRDNFRRFDQTTR